MNQPVRVALLGCGVVGSEVARLLTEQADDLVARVGAPLELVGIAVRRIDRAARRGLPARALHHRRPGTGHPRRRRRRHRGDRRDRARPVAHPRRDGVRRVGGDGQQGVAGRGRRHALRGRDQGGPRRLLRGCGRRRDPDHPAAARVARRRPGASCARHRQRHDQLHPRPDGHLGCELRRGARGGQALGYAEADPTADVEGFDAAAKAAILAGLAFHTRVTAADVHREGITDVSPADVAVRPGDGLGRQAARDLRPRRGDDRTRPTRCRFACTRR